VHTSARTPDGNKRAGDEDLGVVLVGEALLGDVHMQSAEEAEAEALAKGDRGLPLAGDGAIGEDEALDGVLEGGEATGVDGVEGGEDDGAERLEVGDGSDVEAWLMDDVADLDIVLVAHPAAEVADLPRAEARGHRDVIGEEDADVGDVEGTILEGSKGDLVATSDTPVEDGDQGDDAAVGIEVRVKDERAKRSIGGGDGRRNAFDDGGQDVVDAEAGLGADPEVAIGRRMEQFGDLIRGEVRLGVGEVALVEDTDDVLDASLVASGGEDGERLRLYALGGVDKEEGALAGEEGSVDLAACPCQLCDERI
jgi:hypothetical protein